MTHWTHVHLVTDINAVEFKNLVLEVYSEYDIDKLTSWWLSKRSIEVLSDNLSKWDHKQKSITLYDSVYHFSSVIIFFPSLDTLIDDRCELYRGLPTKTLVVPSSDITGCYEALSLSTYHYQAYLTQKKDYTYALKVDSTDVVELSKKTPLYEAIYWARDVINMPPHDMNPQAMVHEVLKKTWNHFDIEVFDKTDLEKLWCNLLLAVWAWSDNPPFMVVLKPKNPPTTEKYAIIGKGVTFDAGGIQIKPDTAMLDMKCDMSWAAGAIGVAMYLDTLPTLPVNITIAIWLTENMTGDNAFKPLDIYTSYNWTTVEIHHTDAEGRLVLADVMWYVEDRYKVDHIITMATLTGACIYALGNDIAGIMWDDEDVISTIIDTSSPYEKVWKLPLTEKMKKSVKAEIADIKNITKSEKAGSSMWAAFLTYFQGKAKLTHLDIAGPAYRETTLGYMPKWWTGWWVKILSEFLLKKGNQ